MAVSVDAGASVSVDFCVCRSLLCLDQVGLGNSSGKDRKLTSELLNRDASQDVAVAVGHRAVEVAPLVEQTCRHVVERHLLPAREQTGVVMGGGVVM